MRIKNEKKLTYILLLMSIPSFAVSLERLNLVIPVTQLQENNATTLTVEGTYSNGETKPLSSGITWRISNPKVLETHGMNLIAKGEGTATIRAEVAGVLSPERSITLYKVISGHRLPPEPDPKINNSTLLGIDSNNNGVRDDVERWVYETYKDNHPIYIDIAMQEARADKKILETPEKAREIHDEVDKAVYCQSYYKYDAEFLNEPLLLEETVVNEYFRSKIYFNTKERMDAYLHYDALLSGDSYTLPTFEEEKGACDFNTSKYEE